MLVKKMRALPVECIVRGYLAGSGWKSYRRDGTVCGIQLPQGLAESEQLPEPLFLRAASSSACLADVNILSAAHRINIIIILLTQYHAA